MKTLKDLSFPVKGIGLTAVLLLLTQSAFALGTDEDTDVDNRATVAYSVGLVAQEVIESDDFLSGGNSTPGVGNGGDTTFEVDRLIDFELTENGDGNTIVAPDETNAITTFLITNSGNDHQDFTFTVSNQGGTFDMNPLTFEIWVDVDDDGAALVRYGERKVLVVVIYTTTVENISDASAENVVVNNPVPEHLSYVAGSAFAPGMIIEFSVDGGVSYAVAEDLTVDEDGQPRAATADDFTHIRFVLQGELAAGAQGIARFRARLN